MSIQTRNQCQRNKIAPRDSCRYISFLCNFSASAAATMINNSSRIGSRRRRIRLFIRFALVCGLLFWFGLQVRDGFYKFIKRQTTVASSAKTFDSGLLPALSFCPGYKGGDYYDVYDELLTFMKEDDCETEKWELVNYGAQFISLSLSLSLQTPLPKSGG